MNIKIGCEHKKYEKMRNLEFSSHSHKIFWQIFVALYALFLIPNSIPDLYFWKVDREQTSPRPGTWTTRTPGTWSHPRHTCGESS